MLLYNELPTAFPWYDKKEKQQRYRENAQQACDYRLLSPGGSLLPFQVKAEYNYGNDIFDRETDFVDDSSVRAATGVFDDLNEVEIWVRTKFLPVTGIETLYYRSNVQVMNRCAFYDSDYMYISGYGGGEITPRSGQVSVPAGAAYVVFNVSNNPETRRYGKLIFSLTTDEPAPEFSPGNISKWIISTCCGIEIDVTNNAPNVISSRNYEDGIRYFYKGEELRVNTYSGVSKMNLSPGTYYSYIETSRGDVFYSEVFTVPSDSLDKYMKIEFWNSCDIDPIAYNDGAGGWKQYMYVDSFIHASEPEVEEDGERDGNDMLIPTFQRMVVRYRFSAIVPDYMKIAIVSLQIHDNVWITTENETRSGRADRTSTSTSIDDNGAYSTVDAIIDQYVMVKKACCSNMDSIDIA